MTEQELERKVREAATHFGILLDEIHLNENIEGVNACAVVPSRDVRR